MDQEWWNAARPSFWDRTAFPTEQDVLDAVWLFQDLVAAAERAGDWADAERFRLIAEAARCEYWQRSQTAYRNLLPKSGPAERPTPPDVDCEASGPFITPGTVAPRGKRRRAGGPRRGPAGAGS